MKHPKATGPVGTTSRSTRRSIAATRAKAAKTTAVPVDAPVTAVQTELPIDAPRPASVKPAAAPAKAANAAKSAKGAQAAAPRKAARPAATKAAGRAAPRRAPAATATQGKAVASQPPVAAQASEAAIEPAANWAAEAVAAPQPMMPPPAANPGASRRQAQPASAAPAAKASAGGNGNSASSGMGWTPPAWSLDQHAMLSLQSAYVERVTDFFNRLAHGEAPVLGDRRFGKAWLDQPQFGWQASWYLLNAEFMQKTAELIDSDSKTRERIRFATQQWIDAVSPANFLASNPEAQAKMIETGGESLRAGIANLIGDIQQGRISQTDFKAFEVGRNVGTTPGTVVYENPLVQLIQYTPTTATVGARPLLVVPPAINKFYILDLQPENSFIGHAVSQGNTVFVVSWRNIKEDLGHLTWDDYLQMGVVDTIEVVRRISGQDTINALGFCVGGTILATAVAALAAKGQRPVASLTLLTTLLDFAEPGTLGIFIDEMQVALREQTIGSGGVLPGRELATTFSALRPNDLIWNYVVNNYLKGEAPAPFDLLYWNADSTNLPGPMFCWFLRNAYLENSLREPGRLTCLGVPIDLTAIGVPTYVYTSYEDHIVTWKAGFISAQTLSGPRRFVVGASGHIAGVVNPPAKRKRNYRTGPANIDGMEAEQWLAQAEEHPGSWWPDWDRWLAGFRGADVPAPAAPGNIEYRPIEPAPGRYVKESA